MPYDIRKVEDRYCVYKRDGGESLGCHATEAAAQAQIEAIYANEKTMSMAAYVYLNLANDPTVTMVMREAQAMIDQDGVEWQPLPTVHVTLAYAPSVSDATLIEIAQEIHAPQPLRLDFAGVDIFENGDERALHIRCIPSEALRQLQASIYAAFAVRGVELSPYSTPEAWQPHITLAYLPPGIPKPIIDTGSMTITDKVIIGRGDYEPFAEITATRIGNTAYRASKMVTIYKQADSPLRLMLIVTSNAYIDREAEIVSEKALNDYVESCWQNGKFIGDNPHLLWHGGDPIGEIVYAEMAGDDIPFLVEISRELPDGPIDIACVGETPILTTVKSVWDALELEDELAASHRFFYDVEDRADGVYDEILKIETSTLPRWAAANVVTLSEIVNGVTA